MSDSIQVKVGSLGVVEGKICADGVECFLGIPYAVLNKRWGRAAPISSFANERHDGTHYGPRCPQPGDPLSITQLAVPGHEPDPVVSEDEFACLNLNITRAAAVEARTNVPVLVWIHGGAYSVGSNSETVYNGIDMIQHSVQTGTPVIHVAINYRLGFFGFLASRELLEEEGTPGVGNYGLWDQNLALAFVRAYIDEFGGDVNRITIFGESAGGASVHSHLLHGEALFNRAICQSGVTKTLGPHVLDSIFHQGLFHALKAESGANSLEDLRRLSIREVVGLTRKLYPSLAGFFTLDDSTLEHAFFPPAGKQRESVPKFCEALMVGCCANEGVILAQSLAAIDPTRLQRCLDLSGISKETLAAYNLENVPGGDRDALIQNLVGLSSDMVFTGPTELVKAHARKDELFVYRIERPNMWPGGLLTGTAHHIIDLLFLGGTPYRHNTLQPQIDQEISSRIINAWIKFGNGSDPWPAYSYGQNEQILTADGVFRLDRSQHIQTPAFNLILQEMAANENGLSWLSGVLSNGAIRM